MLGCVNCESLAPHGRTVRGTVDRWTSFGEDFDRDGAIEPRVSAFVHLAHAAFADLRGDFVDAETGAGGRANSGDYTGEASGGRD